MICNQDRILGLLSLTPCTINEMAKCLTINRNTVAAAVNRLRDSGLISLCACVRPHKIGGWAYRYGRVA